MPPLLYDVPELTAFFKAYADLLQRIRRLKAHRQTRTVSCAIASRSENLHSCCFYCFFNNRINTFQYAFLDAISGTSRRIFCRKSICVFMTFESISPAASSDERGGFCRMSFLCRVSVYPSLIPLFAIILNS